MSEWKPPETMPESGNILVLLERVCLSSRMHVCTRHPNLNMVGGHFDFDMPAIVGWQPLPVIGAELELEENEQ